MGSDYVASLSRDDNEKPQRASQRAGVVETKQENQKNETRNLRSRDVEGDFSTLLEMTRWGRDDKWKEIPRRCSG